MAYLLKAVQDRADRERVLDLWRDSFGNIPAARFDWLYNDASGGGRCWLATTETGEAVGTIGLVFRDIETPSGLIRAGQPVDLVVSRQHRTGAAAVTLLRHLVAEAEAVGCLLLYTFPLRPARLVVMRVGFKPLAKFARWTLPLSTRYKLKSKLPAAMAMLTAPVVDVALRIRSGNLLFRLPSGFHAATLPDFDVRFDELWREASRLWRHVGERGAAFLTWRFRRTPIQGYRIFGLLDAGGRLRVYIVFRRIEQQINIADFLFADEGDFELSLRAFAKLMRMEGMTAVSVQCVLSVSAAAVLRRAGFFERSEEAQVLIYRSPQIVADGSSGEPEVDDWLVTEADRDV